MSEIHVQTKTDRPDLVRQFVAGRDVACPECHFNLRDLTGDRCPECGVAISVGIVAPRPPALSLRILTISSLLILGWIYVSEVWRCAGLLWKYGPFFGGQGFGPVNWLSFGVYSLAAIGISIWLLASLLFARSAHRRRTAWDRLIFGALAMVTGYFSLHLLLSLVDWIRR